MTPQGQTGVPPQEKSFFAKYGLWLAGCGCLAAACCIGSMMFGGAAVALAALDGGFDDAVKVTTIPSLRVDCGMPGKDGVPCDLKRTAGTAAMHACWDLDIKCDNGVVLTGHSCADVPAGVALQQALMSYDTFGDVKSCDTANGQTVKNLDVQQR